MDPLIQQAVTAASSASTAIVVVGERDGEGFDRSSLALPGYQDQLIEAVAAANPRTIVVVHSGGPVLMPWLGSVAAVLEAWYPGEVAGIALNAVLSGAVDPSGRLPVAFPTSDATAPMITVDDWPNLPPTADLVSLGDLGVGSEWYTSHGITPLFPFGYGLSYTSFSVGRLSAKVVGDDIAVSVPVADTGTRPGRYVALADVTYPCRQRGATRTAEGVRQHLDRLAAVREAERRGPARLPRDLAGVVAPSVGPLHDLGGRRLHHGPGHGRRRSVAPTRGLSDAARQRFLR